MSYELWQKNNKVLKYNILQRFSIFFNKSNENQYKSNNPFLKTLNFRL